MYQDSQQSTSELSIWAPTFLIKYAPKHMIWAAVSATCGQVRRHIEFKAYENDVRDRITQIT